VRKRSECAGVVWAGAGVAWRLCVLPLKPLVAAWRRQLSLCGAPPQGKEAGHKRQHRAPSLGLRGVFKSPPSRPRRPCTGALELLKDLRGPIMAFRLKSRAMNYPITFVNMAVHAMCHAEAHAPADGCEQGAPGGLYLRLT
jgi:hypothetical protein